MGIKFKQNALSVALILSLSACGGGGGGSEPSDGGSGGSGDGGSNTENAPGSTFSATSFNLSDAERLIVIEKALSQSSLANPQSFSARASSSPIAIPKLDFHDYPTQSSVSAKSATATPRSSSSTSTNLFSVDAQGQLNSAITSEFDTSFSFTEVSPDGNYVYAAINSYDYWVSSSFVAQEGCAIFKITLSDNSHECAVSGYFAEVPWGGWLKEVNDGRYKPIQFDSLGNVYVLGLPFTLVTESWGTSIDFQYFGDTSIIKIDAQTKEVTTITSDADNVESFIVTQSDSLIYRSEKLNMIPDLSAKNLSTVSLTGDDSWSDGFYAIDDNDTVIYRNNLFDGDEINFAAPSEQFEGGADIRSVVSNRPDRISWSDKILLGDDGFVYSTYNSYVVETDETWSDYTKLKRVLPYAPGDIITIKRPEYFWRTPIYVSHGYAIFSEEQTHVAYGNHDVVGVKPLSGGDTQYLFSDDLVDIRLDIENWRLSNGTIYFTGLNNAKSTMVSGSIDLTAFANGQPQSEYLSIQTTGSVSADSLEIRDLELLRVAKLPENESGAAPKVLRHIQPSAEERYSSALVFNQIMDFDSVENNLSVSETNEAGVPINSVDTFIVWLGNVAHIIFDASNGSSDKNTPLNGDTQYSLTIGDMATNTLGQSLDSEQSEVERTFSWETLNDKGIVVFDAEDDNVSLTSGKAAYIYQGDAKIQFLENANNLDHSVSLVTASSENWELIVQPQGVSYYGYIKFVYYALTDSLAVRTYTTKDGYDWNWIDMGLPGAVAKLDGELTEQDGNITFKLLVTDESGETFEVSRTIDKSRSNYEFYYEYSDDGYGSTHRGLLDNIIFSDSSGQNVIFEENFDTYEFNDSSVVNGTSLIQFTPH